MRRLWPHLSPAMAQRLAGLRFDRSSAPPIVVYQMGKVGSRTVYEALAAARLPHLVYHVHTLSQRGLRLAQKKEDERGATQPSELIVHGRMLAERFARDGRPRWKFITLVREPVRTFLSHVFFDPHIHRPELLQEERTLDPGRTTDYIVEQLRAYDETKTYIPSWFDKEMKPAIGIDVYEKDFPHNAGWTTLASATDDLLILRLEDLSDAFPPAMTNFLPEASGVALKKSNVNDRSADAAFYRQVRDSLAIPREVLESVYASKYARHFYSEFERERYIAYWSEPKNR